jgi:hypothetical protein
LFRARHTVPTNIGITLICSLKILNLLWFVCYVFMVSGHELCMDSLIQLFWSFKSKKRAFVFVRGQALFQNFGLFFFSMDKAFVYFRRDNPYFLSSEEAGNGFMKPDFMLLGWAFPRLKAVFVWTKLLQRKKCIF